MRLTHQSHSQTHTHSCTDTQIGRELEVWQEEAGIKSTTATIAYVISLFKLLHFSKRFLSVAQPSVRMSFRVLTLLKIFLRQRMLQFGSFQGESENMVPQKQPIGEHV
ncbi:hypothetical protein ATANTOWER_010332 [Ataeniobius toweri]|uniref:Uncharacterized protein n=1 Tax=Ataeniobius toweri TaxID=208326 RepID=A0ABU7BEW4_9TELE|nr:hypothetical protein [Ataeniobius toweri]